MRIAFLNGPTNDYKVSRDSRWPERSKSGTLYYPIWLAYAAGVAKSKDHDVLLVDAEGGMLSLDDTFKKLKKFKPELLVMSVTTPTFKNDLRNVDELKTPGANVVLVGTHVSALPDLPLKLNQNVDFVARGEYDYIITELAESMDRPWRVDGVSYRRSGRIVHSKPAKLVENLDGIPWVSPIYKEFLNPNNYGYALARKPMIQILTSRGCPNMCVFCQYPQVFSGRVFRARTPEDVVAELAWINENMPEIKEIFIEDDTFTIDTRRVKDICHLINEKKLKLTWSANVRANLNHETMKTMKSAGARLLVVGYESGNDQILKNIKKGTIVKMNKEFAKSARKAGLRVFGCFMLGLPGETPKTMEETFSMAKELDPDMAFFQQAVPFPGTEMYQWATKNGCLVEDEFEKWFDKEGHFDFLMDQPGLDAEEVRKARDKFMRKFYMRPSFILKTLVRNAGNVSEMKRIMRAGINYASFMRKISRGE
ncbi:radical SAM protein [Candidatus Bathyarchaeota archaeon]|nr:radical SAM protein [Candidatus Bathyarchaeota archaeon]